VRWHECAAGHIVVDGGRGHAMAVDVAYVAVLAGGDGGAGVAYAAELAVVAVALVFAGTANPPSLDAPPSLSVSSRAC